MTPLEMSQAVLKGQFEQQYEALRAQGAQNDQAVKDAEEKLTAAQTLLAHVSDREKQLDERDRLVAKREQDAALKDRTQATIDKQLDEDMVHLEKEEADLKARKDAFDGWIKEAKALADRLP